MKKILKYLIIISSIFVFCSLIYLYNSENIDNKNSNPNYVEIKYREDEVDLNNNSFEYLDTSKSSWIRGAWYDYENEYLIINLKGTKYNYFDVPANVWDSFKRADSFGTFFNKHIKGKYEYR